MAGSFKSGLILALLATQVAATTYITLNVYTTSTCATADLFHESGNDFIPVGVCNGKSGDPAKWTKTVANGTSGWAQTEYSDNKCTTKATGTTVADMPSTCVASTDTNRIGYFDMYVEIEADFIGTHSYLNSTCADGAAAVDATKSVFVEGITSECARKYDGTSMQYSLNATGWYQVAYSGTTCSGAPTSVHFTPNNATHRECDQGMTKVYSLVTTTTTTTPTAAAGNDTNTTTEGAAVGSASSFSLHVTVMLLGLGCVMFVS